MYDFTTSYCVIESIFDENIIKGITKILESNNSVDYGKN